MHLRPYLMIAIFLLVLSEAGAQSEKRNMPDPKTEEAAALMMNFAERTGLTSQRSPQRYLWTDAFAVCNFLGLARNTGDERYQQLALQLVDQVHHTLGQYHVDDSRTGWISGLNKEEGEHHPTRGGLRIGKQLPERGPDEPFDEQLEWERDGQYYHYLTKWMYALDQVTRSTGEPSFNRWARELAETAHHAFTYTLSATSHVHRMYWKMSIDLTRALVPSMGQHDPLDGYITDIQLVTTAAKLAVSDAGLSLTNETAQMAALIKAGEWTTADPLGIGGLLMDAYRVYQLQQQGATFNAHLLDNLLSAALSGLHYYARSGELRGPAGYRLAFRELGLAIGLHAVEAMWKSEDSETTQTSTPNKAHSQLQALMQYAPIRDEIETFWRNPEHREVNTWFEHRDINEVMLATSLTPEGFLVLLSPR